LRNGQYQYDKTIERKVDMNTEDQSFEKIASLSNLVQAQVIESILQEREIPFRIRSFHDTAYDGLYQFQKGWGELYAPADRKAEILEILQSLE
jgi:hypothetical protein